MAKHTPIILNEHFESFINQQIQSGRFSSASEVVQTALKILEAEEEKRTALVNALIEGEQSGFIENFDRKAHLAQLHKKYL